jgi:hypothetical protein
LISVRGFRAMMTERPAVLLPEELAVLLEIALGAVPGAASGKIPAITLAKLVTLRYVQMSQAGPVVTGDGLMRLTASQAGGAEDPA